MDRRSEFEAIARTARDLRNRLEALNEPYDERLTQPAMALGLVSDDLLAAAERERTRTFLGKVGA